MAFTDFNRAIVRRPPRTVTNGLRAFDVGSPSYEGVIAEHGAYIDALVAAGVQVVMLGPIETHPDSLFVEDVALVFTGAAIRLRPGANSRIGEAEKMTETLNGHFQRVLTLDTGTAEGGDILSTPRGVFIGQSARTNAEGAHALGKLLAKLGLKAIPVQTPPGVLHFKSDCSLLDDETILSTPALASSGVFDGFRVVLTPDGEQGAANAIRVNDVVFLSAGYPRTADALAQLGFRIVTLDTREIAKIDAGLSCMSLRWRA